MGIKDFQKNINPENSYVDPLSKLVDGEYKIKLNGSPEFYDSEETSTIDFHFIVFQNDGTSVPCSKRRWLNNQYGINLTAANFMQAGIDVGHFSASSDLAEDFRKACQKLSNKVLIIRKYSRITKKDPDKRFHDFEIIGVSNDIPVTSHEEELPF